MKKSKNGNPFVQTVQDHGEDICTYIYTYIYIYIYICIHTYIYTYNKNHISLPGAVGALGRAARDPGPQLGPGP